MEKGFTLQKAETDELGYVEGILRENGLAYEDVQEKPDSFYIASEDGMRVGVAGLELHGEHGLLRSVAVEDESKGEGYGTLICQHVLENARGLGVRDLYLLTTTAEDFFKRLDFEVVDRESVPPRIRGTTEFTELCPSSAVCMQKDL